MADALDEFKEETGCVPILHPEEIKPQSHYNHDYSESVSRKSHVDDYSTWDIIKATQYGIFERCRELVEAGYDVRQPDKENVTLLHWAAINNRIDLVKYGETPLDLAKQRKNVWMINHLQEARQAKGYDSPSYLKRLKMDKEFRQKVMLGTPFLVIWLVGFIADLDIDSWLIKGVMYAAMWLVVQFLSKSFFDHSMHSALPLGIYLATKFWMYITWFYWFWNDILF
ncbi:palmitoyltransferase ZDHHC17-like [Sinocyclocheilus grahami]|uniref:palmitoyltransferase ZDHHC17-like n=1 Tax=Sinocyclocheilus grahami TaxID=75366 RepID=UPI0007ACED93|nr:PREDICTED: palmitoyltransferase ZDHHC17-like [Sinocyclocheilus grahami]